MRLTDFVHQHIANYVRSIESENRRLLIVDATLGNGHDTLFMKRLLRNDDFILGIDIQPIAVQRSQKLIDDEPPSCRVLLAVASHDDWQSFLPRDVLDRNEATIDLVVINLGYLPRGDRAIQTTSASTLACLRNSMTFLRFGGALSVVAYRGHPGGEDEFQAVAAFFRETNSCWEKTRTFDSISKSQRPAPVWFWAIKSSSPS